MCNELLEKDQETERRETKMSKIFNRTLACGCMISIDGSVIPCSVEAATVEFPSEFPDEDLHYDSWDAHRAYEPLCNPAYDSPDGIFTGYGEYSEE